MNSKMLVFYLNLIALINGLELNQSLLINKYGYSNESTQIYLNNQAIDFIESSTFNGFNKLESINLENNNLKRIDSLLFNGLKQVKYIYLGSNQISSIHRLAFTGLNNLELICLSKNPISLLDPTSLLLLCESNSKCNLIIHDECITSTTTTTNKQEITCENKLNELQKKYDSCSFEINKIKICQSQPCQNGGLCKSNASESYYCDCINSYAGENCQYYNISGSKILNTSELISSLLSLAKFELKSLKLIYRASRDGFKALDFHTKCDNHTNTLTLIKTTKSFIFGGYTTVLWDDCDCSKDDSKAFILSLTNKMNQPTRLNININGTYAIFAWKYYGPVFATDIHVTSESNLDEDSYCSPNGYYQIYDNDLLAGGYNFQTVEIETYTVDILN